jgi:hypothetical protein
VTSCKGKTFFTGNVNDYGKDGWLRQRDQESGTAVRRRSEEESGSYFGDDKSFRDGLKAVPEKFS